MEYPELKKAIGDLQRIVPNDNKVIQNIAKELMEAKEQLGKAEKLLGKIFLGLKSPHEKENFNDLKLQIERYLENR